MMKKVIIAATISASVLMTPIATYAATPKKVNVASETTTSTVYVTDNNTNVRDKASLKGRVIAKVNKGTVATVLETAYDESNGRWHKVQFMTKDTGWVHTSLLSADSKYKTTVKVNVKTLPFYKESALKTQIGQVPQNTLLSILYTGSLGASSVFVQSPSGYKGWVSATALNSTSTPVYDDITTFGIPLNLYEAKSFSSNVVLILPGDEEVTVIEQGDGWVHIIGDNGIEGWVYPQEDTPSTTTPTEGTTFKADFAKDTLTWKKSSSVDVKFKALSNQSFQLTPSQGALGLPQPLPGVMSFNPQGNKLTVTLQQGYTYTLRKTATSVTARIMPAGLAGKVIWLDPGHGGKDSGARGFSKKSYEKDVVLKTALKVRSLLEAEGATVMMTRETDVFIELAERTRLANTSNGDLFVSIHADAAPNTSANGTSTFFTSTKNYNASRSYAAGLAILNELLASSGFNNRGVNDKSLHVTRENELPSTLVELGFMSNKKEEALLVTDAFQNKLALAIKDGISKFFQ